VVVADQASGPGGRQQVDARRLTQVVEVVIGAAKSDLLLDGREGCLVVLVQDRDGQPSGSQEAAQLPARPACGFGGLRTRCLVSSAWTARVQPALRAYRCLISVATGEQ